MIEIKMAKPVRPAEKRVSGNRVRENPVLTWTDFPFGLE
jgi:hypothetical protein